MDDRADPIAAMVQTWAKGFRVSERSEEFQLVVPASHAELRVGEPSLEAVPWGEVLEPLYLVKASLLAREFALLLSSTSATAVAAAHSEDKLGRRSIVVVAATVPVEWSDEDLAKRFGATHALVTRLAEMYGTVLRGSRPEVQTQLRDGRFLTDRSFSLESEEEGSGIGWKTVAREIKRWQGIKGIATPHLVGLGANVLYGTQDEALRSAGGFPLDAFLDMSRAQLSPLNDALSLWPAPEPEIQDRIPEPVTEETDPLKRIDGRLQQIAEQQTRTHNLVHAMFDFIRSIWLPEPPRRKKK